MTTEPICPATTKDGRPCRMRPLSDDPAGFCPSHSPARAAARAESGRRGAAAATAVKVARKATVAQDPTPTAAPGDIAEPLVMRTHEQIRAAMETITNAMRTGALSSRTGAAMVQAARVAMAAVNEDRDRQIAELRQLIADRQPHTTRPRRR